MTTPKTSRSPSISQLAAELVSRRSARQPGATVLLGAGASVKSGIPTWVELAESVCKLFHLDMEDDGAIAALQAKLNRPDTPYSQRYTIFQHYLYDRQPSIGYAHLAQLVRDQFISTILTTNWDALAEIALLRVISSDRLKVLVRGELRDDGIADILAWRRGFPTIVKLHGDLQSRRFMLGTEETRRFSELLHKELASCLSSCSYLVGQSAQDVDILAVLLHARRDEGSLYHVRYSDVGQSEIGQLIERAGAQVVTGKAPSVVAEDVMVNIGDFDAFFSQLNLAVQQKVIESRREHLRKAEQSIIDKEKLGVGYINYARITELIHLFTLEIKKLNPDLILFLDDPDAPGGTELERRMGPIMRKNNMKPRTGTLRVQGAGGSRTFRRSVTTDLATLNMDGVKRVLILDSITFSGNTLRLARDAVREKYPNVDVRLGVLVISQQFKETQDVRAKSDPSEEVISQTVTDRHEIFFPWGVTQTTSAFCRSFEGAVENEQRQVRIARRPWGTIEVLANDELTSARLLIIEAGKKLSFQRHLCRDELFVALDDNIGLDICAENLERDAPENDEKVKSLILEKGDYVLVPRGVWHRTKASMDRVRLLEVAFGLYDQDNDIERRWDDYDRETQDGSG
jgi:mannose-6-phosphate isomerase-like protein (cupin superfamily)/NAD-dependent SIR2 family protein deacetylase